MRLHRQAPPLQNRSPGPLTSSVGPVLQRACACGQHSGGGGECEACKKKRLALQRAAVSPAVSDIAPPIVHEALRSPGQARMADMPPGLELSERYDFSRVPAYTPAGRGYQASLAINQPGDVFEQEADRVAGQVLSAPEKGVLNSAPPRIQRFTGQAPGTVGTAPASVDHALATPGRPLAPALRQDMELRFGYDFSAVRVHSDAVARQSAQDVNAYAYTVGRDIVFGDNQYTPETRAGRRLLAHELAHVVQQSGAGNAGGNLLIQRQPAGTGRATQARSPRLEFRPSRILSPCACLAFIHNNERNARQSAEDLHQSCSYNLAIIGPGQSRNVPIRGSNRQIDPNELFPQSIQQECTRDEAGCAAYEAGHDDLRAMQIQFFLTIKTCTGNFTLPMIVLHNNSLTDTREFLRATSQQQRAGLRGGYSRDIGEGIGSRQELRDKLGQRGVIMDQSGTTNIFRWCNLPEISRCHIGDPDRPDHVIWVTHLDDFNRLRQQSVNVVLQEGLGTATGSESETDLSTLFLRLGPNARFINIETPISPQDRPTREQNMIFIQQVLDLIGLNCCPPVGDFPTPSRTEMIA